MTGLFQQHHFVDKLQVFLSKPLSSADIVIHILSAYTFQFINGFYIFVLHTKRTTWLLKPEKK